MERRLGGARECATVIKYKDGAYRLVLASGARKKLKSAQLLQRKHKLLEAPEGKLPAAAAAVVAPTVSVAGLSDATLIGLEQLEAQKVDDEYDPLTLVGCMLEVRALALRCCVSHVVLADGATTGRCQGECNHYQIQRWGLQTRICLGRQEESETRTAAAAQDQSAGGSKCAQAARFGEPARESGCYGPQGGWREV